MKDMEREIENAANPRSGMEAELFEDGLWYATLTHPMLGLTNIEGPFTTEEACQAHIDGLTIIEDEWDEVSLTDLELACAEIDFEDDGKRPWHETKMKAVLDPNWKDDGSMGCRPTMILVPRDKD